MSARAPAIGLLLRELPWVAAIAAGPLRRAGGRERLAETNAERPPVLVIPGLMANDTAVSMLRRTLSASGYATYGTKLPLLRGITPELFERARQRLEQIHELHASPVVIVGWSLGGLYARALAQRHPHVVRMVVTLGTPFSGDRKANHAWRLYNLLNDHTVDAPSMPDDPTQKPDAHTVAVWSANDGVIAPECARGLDGERDVEREMSARHLAFGSSRCAAIEIARIVDQELYTNAVST